MQENIVFKNWLKHRQISNSIIEEFSIHWGTNAIFGECIVIPVLDSKGEFSFNKYRRNPMVDAKPKYLYDKGGRITLYGLFKAQKENYIFLHKDIIYLIKLVSKFELWITPLDEEYTLI